ncbi:lactate dehydrogenase-like 2-hydroxyacid dehydrogenase [Jiangella mangrovi]|uniref:Lactate dehydrogenase-like 2-hydroxyacid dehydrogenase n=1 Tax=Jiangella mangrovi TaxID=1524084 RepID=A0A7W9LKS2_9ACTN|nr:lactate dehydrogenase-like 2-hydroxyacid dehydrogenase [Jiangella mangrovi]
MTDGVILQVGGLHPTVERELTTTYDALRLPAPGDERERFLAEHGSQVTVAVTGPGMDAALIGALPRLAAVINLGVGYDAVDVEALRPRGIVLSNTPDVLTDCVADLAVGGLIDVFRGLSAGDRFVRRGSWAARERFPLHRKVSGTRVGILGLGRIGRAVAQRLEAFGCTVSYHNRRRVDDVAYAYAASPVELAGSTDALIVVTPGGSDTRALVSAEVLAALGPDGFLVNVARGSVVDQDALVAALASGALGGAALDVFTDEPNVPEELFALDNVVLLPHIGSATVETREAMAQLVLRNLERFLADGTLVTPVAL